MVNRGGLRGSKWKLIKRGARNGLWKDASLSMPVHGGKYWPLCKQCLLGKQFSPGTVLSGRLLSPSLTRRGLVERKSCYWIERRIVNGLRICLSLVNEPGAVGSLFPSVARVRVYSRAIATRWESFSIFPLLSRNLFATLFRRWTFCIVSSWEH